METNTLNLDLSRLDTENATATGASTSQRFGRYPIRNQRVAGASEAEREQPTSAVPENVLSSWYALSQAGISYSLFDRLMRIGQQTNGWAGPRSVSLRASSLTQFLDFWSRVRDHAVEPEIALAPDGSLQAEWYKADDQRLDIMFSEPKVIFGLFAGGDIVEGAMSAELAVELAQKHPLEPLRWKPK